MSAEDLVATKRAVVLIAVTLMCCAGLLASAYAYTQARHAMHEEVCYEAS